MFKFEVGRSYAVVENMNDGDFDERTPQASTQRRTGENMKVISRSEFSIRFEGAKSQRVFVADGVEYIGIRGGHRFQIRADCKSA